MITTTAEVQFKTLARLKSSRLVVQRVFVASLVLGLLSNCQAPPTEGAGAADSTTQQLRLGHGLDTKHPVHLALEHLAAEASRLSGGSLTVTIYPSEQLGSERELVELLQIGSVAMTKISASVMENFDPAFSILSVPYLFSGREHQFAALDGAVGTDLLAGLHTARLVGLGFYDAGSRSFYTCNGPIESPADLEGQKIRTQESSSAMAMVSALGASPTPIAWGELYTALAQGVVDGAENNPPSFFTSRHYEVCPFYALDEHTSVPDVLLMSAVVWSQLRPDHRDVLRQAVRSSINYQRDLWQQATDDALEQLSTAGVEISRPETEPFRQQVKGLTERARSNPRLAELLSAIQAVDGPVSE